MELTELAIWPWGVDQRGPATAPLEWAPPLRAPAREGEHRLGPFVVTLMLNTLGSGTRVDVSVRASTAVDAGGRAAGDRGEELGISTVCFRLDARPRRVLEHGWQSWSVVRPCDVRSVRPSRRLVPSWARATLHADASAAGHAVCGDQFLLMADGVGARRGEGGIAGFLDGRCHLSSVVTTPTGTWAVAYLDGIVVDDQPWTLDPLWLASGHPGRLYSEYAEHWALVAGASARDPRGTKSPVGWCSWYQYFWKLRPDDIAANTALAAEHGFDVVQVDDGYQRELGDWLEHRKAFDDTPPQRIAETVRAAGMTAGIWTAPFLVSLRSDLARAHPDWLLPAVDSVVERRGGRGRRRGAGGDGKPAKAMFNPLAWGGWAYALDLGNAEVLDHLVEVFSTLRERGWDYFKIDFCYAGAFGPSMSGQPRDRRTRAQRLRAGLEAVRAGIGNDAFLVGCGCPLAQGVGVVDAMRVSADTAPRWHPGTFGTPGYRDCAPAAVSALHTSMLRAPLHRRLWLNDPDCLLIRPTESALSPEQRHIESAVIAGSGGFLVVSDDMRSYGDEEWALLERTRRLCLESDGPLSIDDPFAKTLRVRSHSLLLEARLAPSAAGPGVRAGREAMLRFGSHRVERMSARLAGAISRGATVTSPAALPPSGDHDAPLPLPALEGLSRRGNGARAWARLAPPVGGSSHTE